ncbi:MAG: AMP-binding protein [Thermodesulfobacteriota bacterium]
MDEIIRAKLVGEALRQATESAPDTTAYIFEDKDITFAEVDAAADRLATAFLQMGIARGQRIAVIAPNRPEWVITYFAAARIGAVILGVSIRNSKAEILRILAQSRARAVVCVPSHDGLDFPAICRENTKEIPTVKDIIVIAPEVPDGCRSFSRLLATPGDSGAIAAAAANLDPDDELLILYTSGTTGRSKGAALSHRSHLASARAQARHIRANPKDVMFMAMPLSHVGGITCGVACMLLGRGACLLIPQFLPKEALAAAIRHQPTIMLGFPTMHTLLLMEENFSGLDTRGVRLAITGGSNADLSIVRRISAAYSGATIMNLYGLTETSGGLVMSPWNMSPEKVSASVGKPLNDFRVKIVDFMDNPVPREVTGEVCVKGEAVVRGYFRMPEESLAAFDQDGWLRTGDMGYLDEEGFLILMGRKTEMYIQEGLNVFPVEVEECIASHPEVAMVAGIGVPDPVLGEVGRYYVVPLKGEPSLDDLFDICQNNLPDYKRPSQIVIRKSLPLTASGKVNKAALRREFEETGK